MSDHTGLLDPDLKLQESNENIKQEPTDYKEVKTEIDFNESDNIKLGIQERAGCYVKLETVKTEDSEKFDCFSTRGDCAPGSNKQVNNTSEYLTDKVNCDDDHRRNNTAESTEYHQHVNKENADIIASTENCSRDKTEDEATEWYYCNFCDYKAKYQCLLMCHFKITHDETAERFQCQFCEFETKDKIGFATHVRYVHRRRWDRRSWQQCEFCEYKTQHKGYLKIHVARRHHKKLEWHKCHICRYKALTKHTLLSHINFVHGDSVGTFECSVCEYKTKYKSYLNTHIAQRHRDNVELHYCEMCDFKSKYRLAITAHVKIKHGENQERHQCPECHFKSSYKDIVIHHIKNVHEENEKYHVCHYCKFQTKYKSHMTEHFKNNHKVINVRKRSLRKKQFVENQPKLKSSETHFEVEQTRSKNDFKVEPEAHFEKQHNETIDHKEDIARRKGILGNQPKVEAGRTHLKIEPREIQSEVEHSKTLDWYRCHLSCKYKTKDLCELARHVEYLHNMCDGFLCCKFCPFKSKISSTLICHYEEKHKEDFQRIDCIEVPFGATTTRTLQPSLNIEQEKRDTEDIKIEIEERALWEIVKTE